MIDATVSHRYLSLTEWQAAGAALGLRVKASQGFQRYELLDAAGELCGVWNTEYGTIHQAHNVQPLEQTT